MVEKESVQIRIIRVIRVLLNVGTRKNTDATDSR